MEHEKLAGIRMFVMDVDGVLTDSTLYFTENGEWMKGFSTLDGSGIEFLHRSGITTAVITGRNSPSACARARDLGIAHIYSGVSPKLPVFEKLLETAGISHEETAYIGDDLADIPPMKASGVSFAPAESAREAKEAADIVLTRSGGRGAVREACEMILKASGKWEALLKQFLQ